ncbi:unnamed protein product [Allacma fusca]|uniref:Uncharacterized protein n=1 Tax=Allacma fusca TaxID=39272 RepID=A0A8J2NJC8_9HEXA|nr:unnamed protein product [Allacma fusca]
MQFCDNEQHAYIVFTPKSYASKITATGTSSTISQILFLTHVHNSKLNKTSLQTVSVRSRLWIRSMIPGTFDVGETLRRVIMSITVDLTELKDSIMKELKTELIPLLRLDNSSSLVLHQDLSNGVNEKAESQAVAQTLSEISLDIKAIKQELIGTVIKEEFALPVENNPVLTLRQSLNAVASEVQNLKHDLKGINTVVEGDGNNFNTQNCNSVCTKKRLIMESMEPPKKVPKIELNDMEIISNEDFQESLYQEISRFVPHNDELGNGTEGKNSKVISLVKDSRDFYCLGVEITNLTDSTFVNGETCRDGAEEPVPSVILGGSREFFLVKTSGDEKLEGIISYRIEKSDLRLVIYYYVYSSGNRVGIAVCPSDIPVSKDLLVYMQSSEYVDRKRPDKQCDRSRTVIMLKNLLARAKITWGNRSVMSVEVVKNGSKSWTENSMELAFEEKWFSSLLDGKTLLGKSLTNFMSCIKKQFGCVVMFHNGLGVPMKELSWEIRSDVRRFLVPTIMPKTREAFCTSDDLNMQGIFSYRIGSSDLRLSLVFQVFNGGCKFAVAFVPFDIPTNFALMKSMINPKEWRTRPDCKFSQALHGEQVVEVRNLRAKVSMTNGPKAVLTVMICTL